MTARFALWGVVVLVLVVVGVSAYGIDMALERAGIASLSWRLLLLVIPTYFVFVVTLVAWFGLYTRGHGLELVSDFRREAPKLPRPPKTDGKLRRKLKKVKKPNEAFDAEAWLVLVGISALVVLAGPLILPITFLLHGRALLARMLYELSVTPRRPLRSLVELTGRYLLLAAATGAVYAVIFALVAPGAESFGDVWRALPDVDWGAIIDALGDD